MPSVHLLYYVNIFKYCHMLSVLSHIQQNVIQLSKWINLHADLLYLK